MTLIQGWKERVKIASGRADQGSAHRAVMVGKAMHDAGMWDSSTQELLLHDPYRLHDQEVFGVRETPVTALVLGRDYEVVPATPFSADYAWMNEPVPGVIACAAQEAPSYSADVEPESDYVDEWLQPALNDAIDETVLLSSLPSTYNPNNNRAALREIEEGEWDASLPADELAIAVDRIDELMTRNAELERRLAQMCERIAGIASAYDGWNNHRGDFAYVLKLGSAIDTALELIAER